MIAIFLLTIILVLSYMELMDVLREKQAFESLLRTVETMREKFLKTLDFLPQKKV